MSDAPPPPGAAPAPPDPPAPPAPPAPPPPAPTADDRALFHVTEQTRTYPCGACGAQLEFNITRQNLKCPSCGNEQEIVLDASASPQEQDFHAALASLQTGALSTEAQRIEGEKEIVCQNCGGHTTFTGSLTATRCPYCATPIQRDDVHAAPARLPVDGILPFAVDEKTATTAIDKWINGRWFAPNEFKKYSSKGSFASVYTAYFTYDAETASHYVGERGDHYTVTVGSGDNKRTETRTRWSHASGNVRNSFDDIPVFANDGLHAGHVQALEPWPTQDARPFSPEFLAGHLCRTYDRDVRESFEPAKARMDSAIDGTVRRDIGGDEQRVSSITTSYGSLTFKHLLLPIWLLTVIYDGKPFQVMINGVTGEVQGQRPYSKLKIALTVIAVLILIIVLFVVFGGSGAETG